MEKNQVSGLLTSRFYESEHDLRQMLALLMEGRSRTDDWHYAHIGELLLNFCMVARHLDPERHVRLWHAGEKLVGYAMLGEDPRVDFQVLPEYEWCGIEAEAMAWTEERIAELRRSDPEKWKGNCVSGARQDNPERIAFLEAHGFRIGGEFSEVNMLRRLEEPIPEVMIPAGYRVRSMAEVEGILDRAEAHREVWLPWTDGNVSDDDYAYIMRLPGYDPDLDIFAAAPGGVTAAFVNGWKDPLNHIGDFGPVGARSAYRRQGLTRLVLLECLRRMKEHGMNRVCVSTGVKNEPAIRLYESVGFITVNNYIEFVKTV